MELRDYQQEALQAILEKKKGIVVLPTGAGKTRIGIALIDYLQKHYAEVEYYVLVPTLALVNQWYNEIRRQKVSLALGRIMTYASFIKRSATFSKQRTILHYAEQNVSRVTVIIIDEAHHAHISTKLWKAIEQVNPDYLVGFTATPNPYRKYNLDVIYRRSISDIAKYIANLEIERVDVELTEEHKDQLVRYIHDLKRLYAQREKAIDRNDQEKIKELDKIIDVTLKKIHDAISLDENVLETTADLATKIYEKTGERIYIKTLRRAAAAAIMGLIIEKLAVQDIILDANRDILIYTGKQDAPRLFKQKWKFLIGIKALSEGIDIPDLSYAVLSSYNYGNIIDVVQTIGRTLRRTPTKTKAIVYILVPDVPQYERAYRKLQEYINKAKI